MKHYVLITITLVMMAGCGKESSTVAQNETDALRPQPVESAPRIDKAEAIAEAKAAVQEFAGALKAELVSAMQAGGPVAAIGVCNTSAMPISALVAKKHGLHLGRVSLKNRNPSNAPNEWQTLVLEEFESRKTAGEDPASLAWSEIVQSETGEEFRFMKAIPTGDVCLKCHGTEILPEVSEILASLYPEDMATGFEAGDIRGAFVVTRQAERQ